MGRPLSINATLARSCRKGLIRKRKRTNTPIPIQTALLPMNAKANTIESRAANPIEKNTPPTQNRGMPMMYPIHLIRFGSTSLVTSTGWYRSLYLGKTFLL